MKARLERHEKVERKLRLQEGLTYHEAHHIALGKEHKGLTRHQVQVYEGKNGAIARWKPEKKR
jgi:hypothetical protein